MNHPKNYQEERSLKITNFILYIFSLLYLCSGIFALELDPAKFMDVDEIKPGMKGIGKTVFQGTKVEEFQIEVLNVDRNFIGPKNDIIWVMCSGGPLEETGVISGMSGSPVYINGKLIGAIAYRVGSFPKRPIAGVTPIASMLKIFESEKSDTSTSKSSALYPESSLLTSDIQNPEPDIQYPETNITPIQMPVVMSGFHPNVMADIAPFMKKLNMFPVQGGGSPAVETMEANMEPGSTVCIELVKGDAGAYASGTLTYMEGDKILALGHPMMDGMGKLDLPLSLGYVGLLIPSMMASSKRASPIKSIGSLTYDALTGIAGTIGKQSEFIPVKIRIKSPHGGQAQEYNFEVVKNKFLAPSYVFASALNSIYIAEKSTGEYTIQAHWEIKLKDR
ncbi:hypothetical protein FJZ33_06665, partial [Candidatus Poribacteria bacterium]|nr:hypothetical protein [Candidatus Poribacteria bacterium]